MNRKNIKIIIFFLFINSILVNFIIDLLNDNESIHKNRNKKLPNYVKSSMNISMDQFKGQIYYEDYFREARKKINNDNLDDMFSQYLNDFDLMIKKWKEEYKISYHRKPPENYKEWLKFAIDKQCPLHPNYYYQINKDLLPFRNPFDPKIKQIKHEDILKAYNLTINVGLLEVGKSYFNPINSSCNETNIKTEQLRELMTDDLLLILPDKKITIVYNYHDYPRILSLGNNRLDVFYQKKKNSAFKHNECLKRYYSKYKKNTGFLISNKDIRITELLPMFSSCKTICHRDILIPGYHHIREATNNIIDDDIPWEKKLDQLIWRGATTGKFTINS